MTVKKRGFTAKLIPENVLIGISRPLEVRLLYADLDNSGLKPNVCIRLYIGFCLSFFLLYQSGFSLSDNLDVQRSIRRS